MSLQNDRFVGCKMVGVNFSGCEKFLFEVSFNSCVLDFSIFQSLNLLKTRFIDCKISNADFTDANLADANLEKSNLSETVFENTNLMGADFSTATNFSIDPNKNNLRGAKFSPEGLPGLLTAHKIIVTP